ncbi:MAG: YdiU family protein [Actinomycetales bacterium]|nr:YdiU family protein [Actinomycetales bacterium]
MSTPQSTAPRLGARYATELADLVVPWRAAEASAPELLLLNESLAAELGLDPAYLRSDEGLLLLVGNHVPEGATPAAQAYAGHQFGGYSPRLGDGRALLMGELGDGRDLHLKGSGRTPFARGGDGLAAVGPMLREYVISEAMHALGVPTTRSLAVTATGNTVYREQPLPGAVLARVAAGHERVGTFQFARALAAHEAENAAAPGGGNSAGPGGAGEDHDDDNADTVLRRLADHAIARHHPDASDSDNPYLELFASVLRRQADLVARWMLLGFIHGVMNTDNTTISGETIDYGPCAFMESYDPATVFSSIDTGGRYAYGNQPGIVQWNLARFAETLIPLIDPDQDEAVRQLTEVLTTFPDEYQRAWAAGMRAKLGLGESPAGDETIRVLIDDLLALLTTTRVDFTNFFRHLTAAARGDEAGLRELFAAAPAGSCTEADPGAGEGPVDAWLAGWRALDPSAPEMALANPVYIARNHLVEEALDAATAGDLGPVEQLLVVVADPYTERPGLERFTEPSPAGAAPHVTYCGT